MELIRYIMVLHHFFHFCVVVHQNYFHYNFITLNRPLQCHASLFKYCCYQMGIISSGDTQMGSIWATFYAYNPKFHIHESHQEIKQAILFHGTCRIVSVGLLGFSMVLLDVHVVVEFVAHVHPVSDHAKYTVFSQMKLLRCGVVPPLCGPVARECLSGQKVR